MGSATTHNWCRISSINRYHPRDWKQQNHLYNAVSKWPVYPLDRFHSTFITLDHPKKVTHFPSLWCPGLPKLWAGVALSAGDWVLGPGSAGLGLIHEIVLGGGWNFIRLQIHRIGIRQHPKGSKTISRLRLLFLFLQYTSRCGTSASKSIDSFWSQTFPRIPGRGSKRLHLGFSNQKPETHSTSCQAVGKESWFKLPKTNIAPEHRPSQ